MLIVYLGALLAPLMTLVYVLRKSRTSSEDASAARWDTWTPERVRLAALMGISAVTLALIRLRFSFEPDEHCSDIFANAMNSAIAHGTVYFDAIYILSVPLMVIAVLKRNAKWGIAALLLVITASSACWSATGDFNCPGFG
jgi:hypothetical protein